MKLPERGTEEYYLQRDEFGIYIADKVNPERIKAGLKIIDPSDAVKCFGIIYDFKEKWDSPVVLP